MSTRRIRRKGRDGRDIVLDVDLGPTSPYRGSRAASGVRGTALGSPVGHMQATDPLKNHRPGGGWAASRASSIDSTEQPPGRPSRVPRVDKP
jgi:hypothetical protein